MHLSLTRELLAREEAKLKEAERALQADPANKWLDVAVQFARDKVESIRRSLLKDAAQQDQQKPPFNH